MMLMMMMRMMMMRILTGIFAGTKITPDALRQSLQFEEKAPHVSADAEKGPEEKKVKTKKEKMKERRDRWLNKMSSIKQLKEQQLAAARRQHTPVVGDMRPLADALPELCQLIAPTGEEAGADRFQSDETVTETQTLRDGERAVRQRREGALGQNESSGRYRRAAEEEDEGGRRAR
ncbi:hypothetical protein FQN60_006778 [Etheostoma spectabile]|uniref:Family with sequence similarity 207 member A n=1 Tax=Etheostoma spectabile TaxID=54343 RepID=A0A5J5CF73_9PERO|nr:hypothetical protein FQN60_006778 [Etheostoma spectabile]